MIGRCNVIWGRPIFRGDMLVLERYLRVLSKRIEPCTSMDFSLGSYWTNIHSYVVTPLGMWRCLHMIVSFLNDVPHGIFRIDHTKQRFNKNENYHKEYLKNTYILLSLIQNCTYMINVIIYIKISKIYKYITLYNQHDFSSSKLPLEVVVDLVVLLAPHHQNVHEIHRNPYELPHHVDCHQWLRQFPLVDLVHFVPPEDVPISLNELHNDRISASSPCKW